MRPDRSQPNGTGRGRSRHALALVAAGGVLAASTAVALREVPDAEADAFHAMNDLPSWLTPLLWPPMQIGSLWGPVVAGLATWRRWRSWRATAGVVVGGVVAWQMAKVIKSFIRRGRPADVLDYISWRPGTPRDGLGFVSGHTTVVFAMVTVLWPWTNRGERSAMIAAGLVVAFSRIQVGAHLPVDTIGGAALGVIVGELWRVIIGDPSVAVRLQHQGVS